jgi:hypothetical protein
MVLAQPQMGHYDSSEVGLQSRSRLQQASKKGPLPVADRVLAAAAVVAAGRAAAPDAAAAAAEFDSVPHRVGAGVRLRLRLQLQLHLYLYLLQEQVESRVLTNMQVAQSLTMSWPH